MSVPIFLGGQLHEPSSSTFWRSLSAGAFQTCVYVLLAAHKLVLEPLAYGAVSIHDESGQKKDIYEYVNTVVYSDRRMRKWRNEDKEMVIKVLSEKADGM